MKYILINLSALSFLFTLANVFGSDWSDTQITNLFRYHPTILKAVKERAGNGYNIEFNFMLLAESCEQLKCTKDLLAIMTSSSKSETNSITAIIRQPSAISEDPYVIFIELKKMLDTQMYVNPYYKPVR